MSNKRVLYGVLIAALTLNLVVGASLYLAYAQGREADDPHKHYELFVNVLERVRKEYVDGEELTYQELIYGALRGMLDTLDPHSEFMEPEKYSELKKDTEGMFGGVGLVIGVRDEALSVITPLEDTPAFQAGILPGDRIIRIEGASTERFTLQEAVKHLRGQPGTDVTVTVLTPGSGRVRDVTLTRAIIKVESVKDIDGRREFPVGADGIGYIRLSQFGEQTSLELEEALRKLSKAGMRSLVLDLRGNPGGLLDQAVRVAEKFLPRRQLIVYTEGRRPTDRTEYRATSKGRYVDLPMVILVNGGSASAAEIVAGCLQDTTRAVLLGEQTFGKGSVQKVLPLQDGTALRLTTAKYYTPSHKLIHGPGIQPDISVPLTETQQQALQLRMRGTLESLSADELELLEMYPDVQLERAIQVLKGLEIYTQRVGANQSQALLPPERVARAESLPPQLDDLLPDDLAGH
jgi:carboxyl-terminal processing protease